MNSDEHIYLSNYFKIFKNIKIIDVGCGDCSYIFDIINTKPCLKVKVLKCVDSGFSKDRVPRFEDIRKEYNSSGSYKVDINSIDAEYLKTDEFKYLKESQEKYDLIVLSQVLHFFKRDFAIEYLNIAVTKLTDRGIIYICVANEKHHYSEESDKYIFDLDFIKHLENLFNIIRLVKTGSHFYIFIQIRK
jgi:hypothetical protein